MVYAPQLADAARTVEQCFRKSGFSAVHVCQNSNDQTFHNFPNLIHSVPGCCARGTVYFCTAARRARDICRILAILFYYNSTRFN